MLKFRKLIKQKCREIKILKNFNFPFYLILISFLFIPSKIKAQNFFPVSHETGYYEMDSLFFEVFQGTWDQSLYELQWSVNRFTEESFVPYSGGVWLKDRSYTENTGEDVHMVNTGSDGSVSITFHGTGYDGVSAYGKNSNPEGFKIQLICVSDSSFDAIQLVPDGTTRLIESGIVPKSLGGKPPYIIDTEEGWFIQFQSGNGYTIGDYWEITVNPFSENTKTCDLYSDFSIPHGLLKKVNTVRVRLVEKSTQKIVQQEVKIIGFGVQPHGHHILFATADSNDVLDVLGATSDDDIRRNVYLHILNPDGVVEFEGMVEWDKAAGSSSCLPNTGVAFKARGELGAKNMTTSIYGTPGEKVDKIKVRVGGNGQYGAFSSHEIVVRILNDMNLQLLGGVQNTVSTWYLNGSYWSLGFPQEQPRKRFFERVLGVDKDDIDIVTPIPFDLYFYSYYPGVQNGESGNFIVFDKKSSQTLNLPDTIIFFPLSFSNPEDIIQINSRFSNKKQMVGTINDGTGEEMEERFNTLYSELINSGSTESIQDFLDVYSWCRYITVIHFGNLGDIIHNNNDIVVAPNTKIFPVLTDFDGFGVRSSLYQSNWGHIFKFEANKFNSPYSGIMSEILTLINSSPSAMSRLALVYQDLLNTSLKSERTVQIVNDMRDAVMPHYEEYHLSWGGSPNGGLSAEYQNMLYDNMVQFYTERPENAFQLMADYIMPDEGFVLDDRNQVNIVFDSIPQGIVEVKFNSLTLYETFTGLYFPKPQVEVSYVVKEGYSVYVKEYPELSDSFTLGADSTISITFVMRKDSVVNSIKEGWSPPLEIYPNPVQHELFLNGLVEDNLSYSIVSALGSVVVNQLPLRYPSIPVDFLPTGSYFLRVEKGNDFVVKKFIKK